MIHPQAAAALIGMVSAIAVVASIVLLSACSGAAADVTNAQDAAKLSALAYARAGAETPAGALDRGAYCAAAAILQRHDAGAFDAGIVCP